MNRDEAKALLPIIQAFADGKPIQWRRCTQGAWMETTHVEFPDFGLNHGEHCYRIKPEPVWRAWKTDEPPMVFVVKPKGDVGRNSCVVAMVCTQNNERTGQVVIFSPATGAEYTYHMMGDLMNHWTRILEDGTEVPCGALVQP